METFKIGITGTRSGMNDEQIESFCERMKTMYDISVQLLLVIPFQTSHSSTGGTWYTHDYAVKKGVPVEILWPMSEHIQQLTKQGR